MGEDRFLSDEEESILVSCLSDDKTIIPSDILTARVIDRLQDCGYIVDHNPKELDVAQISLTGAGRIYAEALTA